MTDLAGGIIAPPESSHDPTSIRAKAVIFNDPKSRAVLEQIDRVAPSDAPVLIVGETGTGKELVARHLHVRSGRKGPFLAVNCGALTQSLAESELFGHQLGSFTGANESRAGWFEAANGGTLFLDEIGDLPQPLQVKLLRVLQEREVVRVGSRKAVALDVRLVTATNVNLVAAVAAGNFRADLFYRLNVVTLNLPPLRERHEDVLPLVDHFLRVYGLRSPSGIPSVAPEARHALQNYSWPGNIRELENVVHVAVLLATNGVVHSCDLRFTALTSSTQSPSQPIDDIATQLERLFAAPPPHLYQQLEDLVVRRAFSFCAGNQVQTAKLLGMSRNVLRTLLKRVGLISVDSNTTGYDELQGDEEPPLNSTVN